LNWNAHTPLREWDGIKLLGALALNDTVEQDCNSIVQQLDIGSPPLKGKLQLEELGLKLLTHHLLVLKIVDNEKVKGDLSALVPCSNLRTLVLNDTKVRGRLESLEALTGLRRLNLSRTKVVGSIASLSKCPELQTVLLTDANISGHIEAFESCPDLTFCQLDYTKVFGPVESFHHCPYLSTLNLKHTQVTGNTSILRFAAPHCNPREILEMHQRLDPDIN